jgi:hypothetical protein
MRYSLLPIATTMVASMLVAACAGAPSQAPNGAPSSSAPVTPSGGPTPVESAAPPVSPAVWVAAGDLVEPRNAAHVVVLGTGEVLVVGSDWANCGAATDGSDSVEIGDPKQGTWQKTASLASPRDGPAVVALPDGRAVMTAGMTGESVNHGAYSSTYVFDPATHAWSKSGLLSTARAGEASAVLSDGRVLVAGGLYTDGTMESYRVLNSTELWDPKSGTWSLTGALARARYVPSAVTLSDGRVLIVGGAASLEAFPVQRGTAEIYDPTSGTWSDAGSLTTARSQFALVALPDGGAIVAGGFSSERLATVERFDPASNTWSAADDLPAAVAGPSGIMLADGRVLLAGGSVRDAEPNNDDPTNFVSGLTADATVFDPTTGMLTPSTPMPSPRFGASPVLLADGSVLFVAGSSAEGNPSDTPSCPTPAPGALRYIPGS